MGCSKKNPSRLDSLIYHDSRRSNNNCKNLSQCDLYDSYDRKCNIFQIATVNHGSYLFTGTRGGMIEGYKIPVSASNDE